MILVSSFILLHMFENLLLRISCTYIHNLRHVKNPRNIRNDCQFFKQYFKSTEAIDPWVSILFRLCLKWDHLYKLSALLFFLIVFYNSIIHPVAKTLTYP